MPTCEHCGAVAETEDIEIYHRTCRLKAAFPGAYSQEGALVSFDVNKIREVIGWMQPIKTKSGLEFQKDDPNGIWVIAHFEVGNSLGTWSWWIDASDWQRIKEAV